MQVMQFSSVTTNLIYRIKLLNRVKSVEWKRTRRKQRRRLYQ